MSYSKCHLVHKLTACLEHILAVIAEIRRKILPLTNIRFSDLKHKMADPRIIRTKNWQYQVVDLPGESVVQVESYPDQTIVLALYRWESSR